MTLDIHIFPFIPGSCKDAFCCLEIGVGLEESSIDRSVLTMSSVLRSHLVEVSGMRRECQTAILSMRGSLGRMRRATAAGLDMSMV